MSSAAIFVWRVRLILCYTYSAYLRFEQKKTKTWNENDSYDTFPQVIQIDAENNIY